MYQLSCKITINIAVITNVTNTGGRHDELTTRDKHVSKVYIKD